MALKSAVIVWANLKPLTQYSLQQASTAYLPGVCITIPISGNISVNELHAASLVEHIFARMHGRLNECMPCAMYCHV